MMRLRVLAITMLVMASLPAWADADDARAIMREAATAQAETVPPSAGPPTQAANGGTKSRGDGEATHGDDRVAASASAEAHRAAIAAARSEAVERAVTRSSSPGSSTARAANNRNAAADASERGAAAAAQEHAVQGAGHGHGPPAAGGKP
jgi:hypothetical protein